MPPKVYLFGTVKDGKLIHSDLPKLHHLLRGLEGKEVRYLIERKPKQRKARSLEQNRYFWGVVIAILSDHIGYSPEETADTMKAKFLTEQVEVNGFKLEVIKSTTSLSTTDFEDYLSELRMFASLELGVFIPLPNESGYDFEL